MKKTLFINPPPLMALMAGQEQIPDKTGNHLFLVSDVAGTTGCPRSRQLDIIKRRVGEAHPLHNLT